MHQLRGLGPKDLLTVILSVLQVGDHEARHVVARRRKAARGSRADEL
jgi:hypothetical protein